MRSFGQDIRKERRRRQRRGHLAERAAAGLLRVKGYRILERRWASHAGEIDLIAVRWQRLAFVEVKQRLSMEEAQSAITPRLRHRVRRAAEVWLARHPRYRGHDICFDLVLLVPWRLPLHLENGLA